MSSNPYQKKSINMLIIGILLISFFINLSLGASESSGEKIPKHNWSFEGFTGTYDRASRPSQR